jgi:hypothetical protein
MKHLIIIAAVAAGPALVGITTPAYTLEKSDPYNSP